MEILIENASQIVTCHSETRFKSGKNQSEVGLLHNSSIFCQNGVIKWLGKKIPAEIKKKNLLKIDAKNKCILPGFIDSHTHLVFAGSRADEYAMRIKGFTYEEIAKAGGGITSTVKALRSSSKSELKHFAEKRLNSSVSFGVTSIEIKSGYGLNTQSEIKMLEVINQLNNEFPIDIYPTFLGAHAFPKNKSANQYIDEIIYEMIPIVAKRKLAKFIDIFCEKNYFSPKQSKLILEHGIKYGLIPKLHVNQFNSIGGIKLASEFNAISVDHLEVMKESDFRILQNSEIIACVLPLVSYFINIPFAPARKLISKNIPVAIATDFNPGSAMSENIQLAMSMAIQNMKLTPEETINAVTINAAAALNISNVTGSIQTTKQADLLIFDTPNYNDIFYHFGVNLLWKSIKKGKILFAN